MVKVCLNCNNEYKTSRAKSKFCSVDCKHAFNTFLVKCSGCGKEKKIYRNAYIEGKNYFCDNKCQWDWRKKTGENIGENHPMKKDWIDVVCINCKKEFKVRPDRYERNKSKNFYCENKCQNEYKSKSLGDKHLNYSKVDVKCSCCGNIFKKKRSWVSYYNRHFCNNECYLKFIKSPENSIKIKIEVFCTICGKGKEIGIKEYERNKTKKFYCKEHKNLRCASNNNYNWKGIAVVKCTYCNKEFNRRQSVLNATPLGRRYCSDYCRFKHRGELFNGESHPRWNGGPSKIIALIRSISERLKLRRICFERDKFSSVISGIHSVKSGDLHHHHIQSLSYLVDKYNINMDNHNEFADILYNVDNVVTLLKEEHYQFHSDYGYLTTIENFEEFKEKYNAGEYNG